MHLQVCTVFFLIEERKNKNDRVAEKENEERVSHCIEIGISISLRSIF